MFLKLAYRMSEHDIWDGTPYHVLMTYVAGPSEGSAARAILDAMMALPLRL